MVCRVTRYLSILTSENPRCSSFDLSDSFKGSSSFGMIPQSPGTNFRDRIDSRVLSGARVRLYVESRVTFERIDDIHDVIVVRVSVSVILHTSFVISVSCKFTFFTATIFFVLRKQIE